MLGLLLAAGVEAQVRPPTTPGSVAVEVPTVDPDLRGLATAVAAWMRLELAASGLAEPAAGAAPSAIVRGELRSTQDGVELRMRLHEPVSGEPRVGVSARAPLAELGTALRSATADLVERAGRPSEPASQAVAPNVEQLARVGRALAWAEAGQLARARRELDGRASALEAALREDLDAAADDPSLPVGERALLRTAQGRLDAAWTLVEPALAAGRDARSLAAAAAILHERHDPRRARELLLRAAALAPDDADLQLALGRSLAEAGRRDEARAALESAARLAADDPEPAEALAALLGPPAATAHLLDAAQRASARFEIERARRLLAQAQTADPAREAEVQLRTGALELRLGEPERARLAFERAVDLDARDAGAWKGLARARGVAGDGAGAQQAWQEARALAPDDPEALHGLGEAHLAAGRAAEARPLLERAVELRPEEPAARRDLARALEAGGEGLRAAELLEAQPVPEARDLREAARLHLAQGQGDAARAALERAVAIDPVAPEIHQDLARLHQAGGDAASARAADERARLLLGEATLGEIAPPPAELTPTGDDGAAWMSALVATFPDRNPATRLEIQRVALLGVGGEPGLSGLARWLAPRRIATRRIAKDLTAALDERFERIASEAPGLSAELARLRALEPAREDVARVNAALGAEATFAARIAPGGGALEARMYAGGTPEEVALLANAVALPQAPPGWVVWNLPALAAYALAIAGLGAYLVRGFGSVLVRVDYETLGPGFFSVRVSRKPRKVQVARGGSRKSRRARFRNRVRGLSRYEREIIGREVRFRWIPAREWHVAVSGFLEHPATKEIIGNYFEERKVGVRRGRTEELVFDFRPSAAAVEVRVLRGEEPVDGAMVALQGDPASLRFTRSGVALLHVGAGEHTVLVGHAGAAASRRLRVESLAPAMLGVDLADPAGLLFSGCPEAVEPLLHGAREAAALHLERAGQVALAGQLRGESARERGDPAGAAEHFEASGRFAEAGEAWLALGRHERAAGCFGRAGDAARAAETWRAAGDPLRAGRAYEEAYDFEAAADCYRDAGESEALVSLLEKTGEFFEAGVLARELGQADRAVANLQRLPESHATYADACRCLGEIFAERGQVLPAIEKLREAIAGSSAESVPVETRVRLAELLEEAGRLEEALEAWEEVRRRDFHRAGAGERAETLRARLAAATSPPAKPAAEQRYEVQGELGRGGMGIVYRALDRRLGRVVALKRLPESLREHPKAVELFLREARAAAALNHPNIVTVHDVDESEGSYFITMECLEGSPLSALLRKRGRFSARDVARIGLQVCAGLHFAHSQKIVHRDIKPGNFFVTRDKTLKIMDFGLAKSLEEVRKAGTVIGGTPYYMAPEQARGEAVDPRADLYALGVTLFELATGTLPFSEGEVLYHHSHTPAPDPRTRAPDVPAPLAELVLALMAKRPEDRPASAAEVATRLRALLGAAP